MQKNKTALITGASKGIGRAIALALATEGFNLAICARNQTDLDHLKRELQAIRADINVRVCTVDFSDPGQCVSLAEWVTREWPSLDVLVNNVGIFAPGTLLDEAPDLLQRLMQINLYTPHYLASFFGRRMRDARTGHIFNITSIASRIPVATAGAYTVTKYALAGLTQVLRADLRPYGVSVSEIIPGSTWTASWEGTEMPSEQFVQPEDVAQAVLTCLRSSKGANVDEIRILPLQGIG